MIFERRRASRIQRAHHVLDLARTGYAVSQRTIDQALRITGDLDKSAPPISRHVGRRMPHFA